jgi:hypothetical protein
MDEQEWCHGGKSPSGAALSPSIVFGPYGKLVHFLSAVGAGQSKVPGCWMVMEMD